MSELTVSMPAFNSGQYIKEAINSVLGQDGVDFELIVIDDGSNDNTAEIANSFADARIRLIINRQNMGIAHCHNLVIEQCKSTFIAHVDSDDIVLPGAFKRMLKELKSNNNISYVHCNYTFIDDSGQTTNKTSLSGRKRFIESRDEAIDYRRALLIRGGEAANHLRTYRREVFDIVGPFNERLKYGEDYDMALRIADKFAIKLVPDMLYLKRIHKDAITESLPLQSILFFFNRLRICRNLVKSDKITFTKNKKYNLGKLMIWSLLNNIKELFLFIR
ncbi:MAG: glycosyltransferase family 2 protein [Nitrospinales bacterium]